MQNNKIGLIKLSFTSKKNSDKFDRVVNIISLYYFTTELHFALSICMYHIICFESNNRNTQCNIVGINLDVFISNYQSFLVQSINKAKIDVCMNESPVLIIYNFR